MPKSKKHYTKLKGFLCEHPAVDSDDPKDAWVGIDRTSCPELPGTTRWLAFHPPTEKSHSFPTKEKLLRGLELLAFSPEKFQKEIHALTRKELSPLPRNAGISARFQNHMEAHFEMDEVCQWIRELCEAMKVVPCEKDAEGNVEYDEVPDYASRKEGLKLLLAYMLGQPIQRQETVVHTVKTPDQIKQRIEEDPAYRNNILDTLGGALGLNDEVIQMLKDIPKEAKGEEV